MSGFIQSGRFSSAFSPLSLSPALWLDASDTATITSSGGSVSQWDDKSGNNHHVTQSTAGAKPTTGSATQNGLNVLSFDGGDRLSWATPWVIGTSYTLLAVVTPSSGVNNYLFQADTDDPNYQDSMITKYASKSFELYADRAGGTARCTIGSGSESGAHALGWTRNGLAFATYMDGAASNTASNASVSSTVKAKCIGASVAGDNATAYIMEWLIVTAVLSAGDLAAWFAYAKTKWATP